MTSLLDQQEAVAGFLLKHFHSILSTTPTKVKLEVLQQAIPVPVIVISVAVLMKGRLAPWINGTRCNLELMKPFHVTRLCHLQLGFSNQGNWKLIERAL